MSSKPIVLVTGGTGFVGSHVIDQLLREGYHVRAPARIGKTSNFNIMFPDAGPKLKVFEVADLATGDFSEALRGVAVLVHVAAPGHSAAAPHTILSITIDGTLNIVNQAIGAGVKKIVATGSFVALFGPDFARAFSSEPLSEKDWNTITAEQVNDGTHPMIAYIAGKTVAERKLWELSEQHKDIDFTTIVPPAIFGPLLKTFPRPSSRSGLSTLDFVYRLVTGEAGPNTWPNVQIGNVVHIFDVVRAHVLAVAAPPLSDGRKKRLVIGPGIYTWQEGADLIKRERPELISRLPRSDLTPIPTTCAPLDTSLAEEVLGIKAWLPWEKAFLEAMDSALEVWEKGEANIKA
ncbi:hypothetical protein BOTBODRAFT_149654 [Botryobasidium botryosum FD-172 SS1]|uniref:NAD-dependent epimerase/dehydratase domain-containing protein n=1 Tax=Botryobasidium botryosum (strain FD-172 SS1) TaxID=930990 RepID=A0A067LTA9_BOTB1|nr:hypothetical protein BOTBODRAFT_149654 [Botryobasidium botryosum FD-172 SS1]